MIPEENVVNPSSTETTSSAETSTSQETSSTLDEASQTPPESASEKKEEEQTTPADHSDLQSPTESPVDSTAVETVKAETSATNHAGLVAANASSASESASDQTSEDTTSSESVTNEASDPQQTTEPEVDASVEQVVSATDEVTQTEATQIHEAATQPSETEPATEKESKDDLDSTKKVGLNPTQSGEEKAVPTIPQMGEEFQSSGPVEIPSIESLDDDLEAQIAAAMSGEEKQSQSAPADLITPPEEHPEEDTLEAGIPLKGKVQSVHGENVFLDLGYRSPGLVPARQFAKDKPPEENAVIDVIVQKVSAEEGLIYVNLPRGKSKVSGDWTNFAKGQTIECIVAKVIKGGLEVNIGTLRGFMPASQVDIKYVQDLEQFVGEKLTVQVTQVNPKRRNLVVSRRACLEQERKEAQEMLWTILDEGQIYDGIVRTIKDFGAFVDIGGVDAFLHIGQMSWTRINHPKDLLSVGDEVKVKVISLDREKKKISVGLKQLTTDPWSKVEENYPQGSTAQGKVVKVEEFGAFVELEPNVEGLVHISQLAHRRVNKVTEVLKINDVRDFYVLEVNPKRKRISLSVKALEEAPQDSRQQKVKPSDEDLAPGQGETYTRQRTEPLKGGREDDTTGSNSGGLFGNPDDFD